MQLPPPKQTFLYLVSAFLVFGCTSEKESTHKQSKEPEQLLLANDKLAIKWQSKQGQWQLAQINLAGQEQSSHLIPSGQYTFLYSNDKPAREASKKQLTQIGAVFEEEPPHSVVERWREATIGAAQNNVGQAIHFFPEHARLISEEKIQFKHSDQYASIDATWQLDAEHPEDIRVQMTLTAKQDGYYSMASPTASYTDIQHLSWASVPGVFAGKELESRFINAFAYGQGLPQKPVLAGERSASSLSPLLTTSAGITHAVIAEPGTATDPWQVDKNTRKQWRLGLSHMNRQAQLSPTLYHPVLGEVDSKLNAGQSITFHFRYSFRQGDWFDMTQHVAYDVYGLNDFLSMKKIERSLSARLRDMRQYVTDAKSSLWRVESYEGEKIGAQAYYGDVVGSQDLDAMKNSDYGAMWMLGELTQDPTLLNDRLPAARQFKLAQQNLTPGFFNGAARGQYYLSNSHKFTEEWGDYVEPVGSTYYILSDLGNMALFTPQDKEVIERIRLGADKILNWQKEDGSWEVAYDSVTQQPLFTDVKDYRPTFYGLMIAYRILGDEKYLIAAKKGADWLIEHAVKHSHFLGVCGDTRFAPDFATAQIAQALLDLHEITGEQRYLDAGIKTVKFYASSVYTHPKADHKAKRHNQQALVDWQLNQTGLGFEHGGSIGSANKHGPILLASHAGLFIRAFQLTGDTLLRDFARAGALARTKAFVDPKSGVASYYWNRMNNGPGQFPHHAWWQIGWITDYLVSELALRSDNQISFPRGFFTPKVGPHAAYGFASGRAYGQESWLIWGDPHLSTESIDSVMMHSPEERTVTISFLNATAQTVEATAAPVVSEILSDKTLKWQSVKRMSTDKEHKTLNAAQQEWALQIAPYGLVSLQFTY